MEIQAVANSNPLYSPFEWEGLTPQPIIGVDEVGRGCLAGPVYAAAVILDHTRPFRHYTDSKLLSAARREILAKEILENHQVGIGFATVQEIDQINILQASLLAMARAVAQLKTQMGHLIVDGNQKIPQYLKWQQTTVIKGDLRAEPIAAASIVAKVTRDKLMMKMDETFPLYGFKKHKGYSTVVHKKAIEIHGPCPEHRLTFAGVKEFYKGN